jgi:Coenzyme PQQ synthesis protein D (PqqD)
MYKFSPAVRRTSDSDGAIVLNIRHGMMFKVNSIGLSIWEMLEQNLPFNEIVSQICTQFPDQPRQQITADVLEFLRQLKNHNLLQDC